VGKGHGIQCHDQAIRSIAERLGERAVEIGRAIDLDPAEGDTRRPASPIHRRKVGGVRRLHRVIAQHRYALAVRNGLLQ
jgi:hypothetical protein